MADVPGFDPTLISETEVSGIADPEHRRKQDGGGDTQRQQASHGAEFSASRSAFPPEPRDEVVVKHGDGFVAPNLLLRL